MKTTKKLSKHIKLCVLFYLTILAAADAYCQKISYSLVAQFKDNKPFDIRHSTVSANKNKIAVAIKDDKGEYVSINGLAGPHFQRIISRSIIWSKTDASLIYVGEREGSHFIVQDGTESKITGFLYTEMITPNPTFGESLSNTLWTTTSNSQNALTVNGANISTAQKISYAKFRGKNNAYLFMERKDCEVRIVDSVFGAHPYFKGISRPIFSISEALYIYEATTDLSHHLVRENKDVIATSHNLFPEATISPDGSREPLKNSQNLAK